MKASVVIVMQQRPRQRCRHEVQRCSGGLHAISESRPSQGHGRCRPPSSGQMTQRLPGEVCPLDQSVDNRDCNTSPWCNNWQKWFLSKAQSLFKLHPTTLRTNGNRNYFQIPVDVTLRIWAEPIFVLDSNGISLANREESSQGIHKDIKVRLPPAWLKRTH